MYLVRINKHDRDDYITFKEENHEYNIIGMKNNPISVTTLIHKYFPQFNADKVVTNMMRSSRWSESKYFGMTREEIKDEWEKSGAEAARLGTIMHKNIEDYLDAECSKDNQHSGHSDNPDNKDEEKIVHKEFTLFKSFWKDFNEQYPEVVPYRTEWLVYDEDIGIAGSIDFVLTDKNGNLIIVDWKRSKEIKIQNKYEKGLVPFNNYDNCNYSHYSLQLNFYRHILETKYGKLVIFMMLVILHPNQTSYLCYPINRIDLSNVWSTLTSNISKEISS